jgi:hypothetical protein
VHLFIQNVVQHFTAYCVRSVVLIVITRRVTSSTEPVLVDALVAILETDVMRVMQFITNVQHVHICSFEFENVVRI